MNKKKLEKSIVELIKNAETKLPDDVIKALKNAYKIEKGIAKIQINNILKNIELAKKTEHPMCQDTGIQNFYIKVGVKSPYINSIKKMLENGLKKATEIIPLRPNSTDPISQKNNFDNVDCCKPNIIWDFYDGSDIFITAMPRGAGSENMTRLEMLNPTTDVEGIKKIIISEVIRAGGKPCPPTVVGVGIGGGADIALKLSKQALLRPVGGRNKDKKIAALEKDLIKRINKSGIGPMGLGGKTTVLDVHVETAFTHPANLPVGISIQCWANRRACMVIHKDGTLEVK